MKKDKLQSFVDRNREAFDAFEPSTEAWQKIEEKVLLKKHKISLPRLSVKRVISYAATILAIFTFSYIFHEYRSNTNFYSETSIDDSLTEISDINDSIPQILKDFSETQNYYLFQVSNKMENIEQYADKYPELVTELKQEIAELNAEYSNLNEDLSQNINNVEVVQAMIQNYRIKLDILEDVLNIIKNSEEDLKKETQKVIL
ncbi:MAG: hypothetical protein IPO21_06900 [Bacteroidales bacterium]|nr:hypothetical protein [Bacteroidales bacterium]